MSEQKPAVAWVVGNDEFGYHVTKATTRARARRRFVGYDDEWRDDIRVLRRSRYDNLTESEGHDMWVRDMERKYGENWGEVQ